MSTQICSSATGRNDANVLRLNVVARSCSRSTSSLLHVDILQNYALARKALATVELDRHIRSTRPFNVLVHHVLHFNSRFLQRLILVIFAQKIK